MNDECSESASSGAVETLGQTKRFSDRGNRVDTVFLALIVERAVSGRGAVTARTPENVTEKECPLLGGHLFG